MAHTTHVTHLAHNIRPGRPMWPTSDPHLTHYDPGLTQLGPSWPMPPQPNHSGTDFSHFCYILLSPRGTCFSLYTHITTLDTQFWLCSPQNFMKCLLNTPISLHKTASLLNHQLCYLTSVLLHTLRTHKFHQKVLWEGGTWHSQIHLHNHSFKSHGWT